MGFFRPERSPAHLAETLKNLPGPDLCLGELRLPPQSTPRDIYRELKENREQLCTELGLGDRTYWLKNWINTYSRNDPLRIGYNEAWKRSYAHVREHIPEAGWRDRRRITSELVQTELLSRLRDARDSQRPGINAFLEESKRGLRHAGLIQKARYVVYPLVATLFIPIGARAHDEMVNQGMLPDPVRYMTRNDRDVLNDAAAYLRSNGKEDRAQWLESTTVEELQREAFRNLGLSREIADQYMRRDGLNHLGFFGANKDNGIFSSDPTYAGEMVGCYQPLYDSIHLEPHSTKPFFLVHEFGHRNGHFKETGFLEKRSFVVGPGLELEEGLCYIAGGGLLAARDYNNALNIALLAELVGMPEHGIHSVEDAQQAYRDGIAQLGRAFLIEHSTASIQRALDTRYGAGTFHNVVYAPFKHDNGGTWMNAALINALEKNGAEPLKALEGIEATLLAESGNTRTSSKILSKVTSVLLERTFVGEDEKRSAELARQIAVAYPNSVVGDAYQLFAVYHQGTNLDAATIAELGKIYRGHSASPWWAECSLKYAGEGFNKNILSAEDALRIVDEVTALFPGDLLAHRASYVRRQVLGSSSHNFEIPFLTPHPLFTIPSEIMLKPEFPARLQRGQNGSEGPSPCID